MQTLEGSKNPDGGPTGTFSIQKLTCDSRATVFACETQIFKLFAIDRLFMHEWALAESIIATAVKIARDENLAQVTDVTVRVGEMQQVESGILRFAFSQLKPESLKSTRFHILKAKTNLKCQLCGNTRLFSKAKLDKNTAEAIHFVPEVAHTFIKCPKCGSPDFEIAQGRGVWIESVKGAKK
jgi:hydrogenase nickel incorporation protein HypA/HybF